MAMAGVASLPRFWYNLRMAKPNKPQRMNLSQMVFAAIAVVIIVTMILGAVTNY
jgi:hypothetical protein